MGDLSNNQMEVMQRINAMLENSLDISNLTGEVAPKRNNYSGKWIFFSVLILYLRDVLLKACFTHRRHIVNVGPVCWVRVEWFLWEYKRFAATRWRFDQSLAEASTQPGPHATPVRAAEFKIFWKYVVAFPQGKLSFLEVFS